MTTNPDLHDLLYKNKQLAIRLKHAIAALEVMRAAMPSVGLTPSIPAMEEVLKLLKEPLK